MPFLKKKKQENKIGLPKEELEDLEETSFTKSLGSFFWEIFKVIIISLAIIIPVRYFLIQPFYVKGASMEPSFYDHEYLIINEIEYRFENPARGDIIVFHNPSNFHQFFIKRIIALPRERIKISRGDVIIYNLEYPEGIVLDESAYLSKELKTKGEIDVTLDKDEYFVLGDNRNLSLDSRSFGPVKRENIIGRVWLRGWPPHRLTHFERPRYNF